MDEKVGRLLIEGVEELVIGVEGLWLLYGERPFRYPAHGLAVLDGALHVGEDFEGLALFFALQLVDEGLENAVVLVSVDDEPSPEGIAPNAMAEGVEGAGLAPRGQPFLHLLRNANVEGQAQDLLAFQGVRHHDDG